MKKKPELSERGKCCKSFKIKEGWYTSMELYQLAQKIHERVLNYFLQLTPSHLEVCLVIISPKINAITTKMFSLYHFVVCAK